MPVGLNQKLPRQTRMSRTYKIFIWLSTVVFLGLIISLTVAEGRKDYKIHVLQIRGLGTDAQIVSLSTEKVKGGIDYYVDYQFQAAVPGVSSLTLFQGEDNITESHYETLQQSAATDVPILYDPLDPSKSLVHMCECIYYKHPFDDFREFCTIMWSLFGLIYGIILSVLLVTYFRQRNLLQLGTVVAATIVSEREYAVKGGRRSALTYEFVDSHGRTQQGVRKGVMTKDDYASTLAEDRAALVDNPTALFDPLNSGRNMLYPPAAVRLA